MSDLAESRMKLLEEWAVVLLQKKAVVDILIEKGVDEFEYRDDMFDIIDEMKLVADELRSMR